MTAPAGADWLEALEAAKSPEERAAVLAPLAPADAAPRLHGAILSSIYNDRPRALLLNSAVQELAALQGDSLSRAWAARSQGHVEHVGGDYAAAVQAYEQAADLFQSLGVDLEVGRTLSSGLQALIFRGEYDRAIEWASRAETIFQKHGDLLRLARLDSNVGNIYFRQDRPRDALARYQRALEGLELVGGPGDIAAALSNLAVASINVGQFAGALAYYGRAREHCETHGLANLAARADYNIAYLHYLRGDYARARQLYELSRERCRATGDAYHAALCDLDEAEMYLELNLIREGDTLAHRAVKGFEALGMPYEQAKAMVNVAVAASQRRDYGLADEILRKARRLFAAEKNPVWPALVDQLRAVLAFHDLRFQQAQRLGSSAWRVLTRTMVPGRAAHCQILLSRLWLRTGFPDRARALSREALERAGDNPSPSLRFHAHMVEGEIHERQGRLEAAVQAYEAARREVDDMRGRVDIEDLRISILSDKLAVYEGLVSLYLDAQTRVPEALLAVQQAKSRSLADRLSAPATESAGEAPELRRLRHDLNSVYRHLDVASAKNSGAVLRARARELEIQLLDARASRAPVTVESHSLEISALQTSLREGELLLEYYEARGSLYAFLVSRDGLEVVRLGSSAPMRQMIRLLVFQLGKFPWRRADAGSQPDAVSHHLRELYRMLLKPFEDRLPAFQHLIVAPHRELHSLPFAALHDGGPVLAEQFTLSAAPSASVFARCRARADSQAPRSNSVVMAVPDVLAPHILEEAQAVAAALPGSTLLTGDAATLGAFWKYAPSAQVMHLAAHGVFRRDNPLFSALQLADERLSLLDLQQARLNMDLLTLSACNTGSSVPVGGDELLGLMRGFLLAGVRSVLVTLWEIDDTTAPEFMAVFYRGVTAGLSLAGSVRAAMHEIRERYPHPYHWAPYLLVGNPDPVSLKIERLS